MASRPETVENIQRVTDYMQGDDEKGIHPLTNESFFRVGILMILENCSNVNFI